MNGRHCFGQTFVSLVLSNKHFVGEGFRFYVRAVGFIYLMSTNLFISKRKHLREIIEKLYCLFFPFKIRIGQPFSFHFSKLEEQALQLI